MKFRILFSIGILALFFLSGKIYDILYSPISGAATAAQFNDSVSSYTFAKFIRDSNAGTIALIFVLAALGFIWSGPIAKAIRGKSALLLIFICGLLSACQPYKTLDVIEVQSNETAWAIPLDALSKDGQVKFNSVEFLNQKKIPAKRIMIDKVKRDTGRMYWDIEWIPTTRVIKVDRSLITAQWTDGKSDKHDDDWGIGVVTSDSVMLRVGLTLTCSIDEDDASSYLYYHGRRPLSDVMQNNVRSYAIAELTREYSKLDLAAAQKGGEKIYKELFEHAKEAFKSKGVTVQYLGNAEGLTYGDPNVQNAINRTYLAQQDAKTASEEQMAQKTRNATRVMNAQAEADAANKLFAAKEAALFQNELQVKMITAQAQNTMANRWNGGMPASVLPGNSPMLMQLGTAPAK